ncbi:MAG: response regulator [Minisyncoccia bacterium]
MKTILVIDDDMLISKTLEMKIEDLFPDYKIDTAFDFNKALELLKSKDYSLITLDGNLDGNYHGRQILEKMTEIQKRKTIICSNDDDFVKEAEAVNILTIKKTASLKNFKEILSRII